MGSQVATATTGSQIATTAPTAQAIREMCLPATLSPPLTGRDAVADALHRFMMGMDTNDLAMFDSAFTADTRWDLNGKILEGLDTVHDRCYNFNISKLDTTHFVTSTRINIAESGKDANLSTLYQAQHYRGGRGTVPSSTLFETGGLYFMDLVFEEAVGLWKIKTFKMRAQWIEGDRAVMGHKEDQGLNAL